MSQYKVIQDLMVVAPNGEHVVITKWPYQAQFVARALNLLLTMAEVPGVFTMEEAWRKTIAAVLMPLPVPDNNPARDQLAREPDWAAKWIPDILRT